jgi:hypothetical protein
LTEKLEPLGFFAILSHTRDRTRAMQVLRSLEGKLAPEDVAGVASYLRSGVVLLALMEQSEYLLADGVTVAGGSGIRTDGRWFWRNDTADYVARHRTALPTEFVEHARKFRWMSPHLSEDEVADADRAVSDFYHASLDRDLWPPDTAPDVRHQRSVSTQGDDNG